MEDVVPFPTIALDRVRELGLDLDGILARAGIASLAHPRMTVTTAQFFAFWEELERVAPSRDLGLELGAGGIGRGYDLAGLVALHSTTYEAALAKYAKYKRLVCPEAITVARSGKEARIRFDWVLASGSPPRLMVDGTFASLVSLLRHGTGKPLSPLRLELVRRKSDVGLLREHFGCDLVFDAPLDVLVVPASFLDEPFVPREEDLLALLLPGLDADLAREPADLVASARLALLRRMCGERPSVEKVAADLRVSTRTLQRRLGETGTSYQRLLDDVRAQAARRLLARTNLDPNEVAFVLGFEEANSFTRAFHAWEGTTPLRYRAAAV